MVRFVGQDEPGIGIGEVVPYGNIQKTLEGIGCIAIVFGVLARFNQSMRLETKLLGYEQHFRLHLDPLAAAVTNIAEVDQRLFQARHRKIGGRTQFIGVGRAIFAHMRRGEQFHAIGTGIK